MDPKKYELRFNARLYKAVMNNDEAKVVDMCRRHPNGPLHILTIHHDTVLHIAAYHRQEKLVLRLLELVCRTENHTLTWQNNGGNTILHETCTNSHTVEAAREMLRRAPVLLSMTNREGETPLFYAARHGKTKIFKLMHAEVSKTIMGPESETFLRRGDKFTILQIAILSKNYWIAYEIADKYRHLMHEKDGEDLTPLQLLSCRPPEFDNEGFYEGMVYKWINLFNIKDSCMRMFPELKRIWRNKESSEWVTKLVKLLVENDVSWKETESMTDKQQSKLHSYRKTTSSAQQEQILAVPDKEVATTTTLFRMPDTPLLLATKHGCTKIVEEILQLYPQAVEHVDIDGRNILHWAIMYRREEVIDLVEELEYPKKRLRGKIDRYGNSLLHMVRQREDDGDGIEEIKDPAVILQEDLRLFERVKKLCRALDPMKLNFENKTADKVFIDNSVELRSKAKEFVSEMAKNCSIVAGLVVTAAFTAAYTVPGGTDNGLPVLRGKLMFQLFAITDTLSLSLALTSIIMFLSVVSYPFHLKDFQRRLVWQLRVGLLLLVGAVTVMMVTFAATLILTISSGRKWTDVSLYFVSFFPICVFVLLFAERFFQFLKASSFVKALQQMIKKKKEMSTGIDELEPPDTGSMVTITPSIV